MELQQRIQRLEDIEAIRKLKACYFHACDSKQIETIRNCFAEGEVLIDYGQLGCFTDREALITLFSEKACYPHIVDLHHGQNAQIEWIDETQATAVWDLFFHQIDTSTDTLTQLGGYYQDHFIKQDGRWVIQQTVFTVTSSYVANAGEGDLKVLFAGAVPA